MEKSSMITNVLQHNKDVRQCIHNVRGYQVMLDSDVAFFFGVETRRLNEQMKRNANRFPEDFCFQLNSNEFKTLRSQNATFNNSTIGRKYLPFVYTEHGIVALAGVIKNDTVAKMSVEIARTFIQMRRFILENGETLLALARLQNRQLEFENETSKRFDEIIKMINGADLPKQALFCGGQYYDAYDFISNLIERADSSIVLVDSYCDRKALSFLKNRKEGVNLTIIKSRKAKLSKSDVDLFEKEFGHIHVFCDDAIHDRFLFIDEKECYLLGTSLNSAGKKLFAVIKIEEEKLVRSLLQRHPKC